MKTLLCLLAIFFIPQLACAQASCGILTQALQAAEHIRELKAKRKIPCELHSKAEVEKFLRATIAEKMPKQKLLYEEKAYKLLGILPENYNYHEGIIDLYLSQLGGYYDPAKKHFVMAGWMPSMVQQPIAVHELVHALQDQHFDLEKFTDEKIYNSDELLARSAFVEGDASAVMMDYMRKLQGLPSLAQEKSVQSIIMQNVLGASFMQASQTAPPALMNMLLFPYNAGLRFVHVALQKYGGYKELKRVFQKPPQSSEEILHPEIYFAGKPSFRKFTDEELVQVAQGGGQLLYRDTLGEIGISAIFSGHEKTRSAGPSAAAGWGGDAFGFIDTPESEQNVFVWVSTWDTPEDALEFSSLFQKIIDSHQVAVKCSMQRRELEVSYACHTG